MEKDFASFIHSSHFNLLIWLIKNLAPQRFPFAPLSFESFYTTMGNSDAYHLNQDLGDQLTKKVNLSANFVLSSLLFASLDFSYFPVGKPLMFRRIA